jgi:hypothetical protein
MIKLASIRQKRKNLNPNKNNFQNLPTNTYHSKTKWGRQNLNIMEPVKDSEKQLRAGSSAIGNAINTTTTPLFFEQVPKIQKVLDYLELKGKDEAQRNLIKDCLSSLA